MCIETEAKRLQKARDVRDRMLKETYATTPVAPETLAVMARICKQVVRQAPLANVWRSTCVSS